MSSKVATQRIPLVRIIQAPRLQASREPRSTVVSRDLAENAIAAQHGGIEVSLPSRTAGLAPILVRTRLGPRCSQWRVEAQVDVRQVGMAKRCLATQGEPLTLFAEHGRSPVRVFAYLVH